ncbi:CHAT domain protein [Ceratobasidium sp. AG-Ba]|nr:CHAT domain protein [Ceratobasidium sp. AG-Ba]
MEDLHDEDPHGAGHRTNGMGVISGSATLKSNKDSLTYLQEQGFIGRNTDIRFLDDSGADYSISEIPQSTEIVIMPLKELHEGERLLLSVSTFLMRSQAPDTDEILTSLAEFFNSRDSDSHTSSARAEQLMSLLGQAAAFFPKDDENTPRLCHEIGTFHANHFEQTKNISYLHLALDFHEKSVQMCPTHNPKRPEMVLDLATTYRCRFEALKNLADIDTSISLINEAMLSIDTKHLCRPGMLSGLAAAFTSRFQYLKELSDIDSAIELLEQAISLTEVSSDDFSRILYRSAVAYVARYMKLQRRTDLERAIACFAALSETGVGADLNLPNAQENLASQYYYRFCLLGKHCDINLAIEVLTTAVDYQDGNYMRCFHRLINLSMLHGFRFVNTDLVLRDTDDIVLSMRYAKQAVDILADDHVYKCTALRYLGNAQFCHFENLGDVDSLDEASKSFKTAAEQATGPPTERFSAARIWAYVMTIDSTVSPTKAFRSALELMHGYVWLGNSVQRRYNDVKVVGSLAVEAASHAILWDEFESTVEILEMGRLIVWSQLLQLRAPVKDLHLVNPVLASRLIEVGQEIEHRSMAKDFIGALNNASDQERSGQARRRLVEEWNTLVSQARETPGFHNFLTFKTMQDLRDSAISSAVVIVNIHWANKSDALVLMPGKNNVLHIPLSGFSATKAKGLYEELSRLLMGTGLRERSNRRPKYKPEQDSSKGMDEILSSLWFDLAKPILAKIGYLNLGSPKTLPRVTWCVTGDLCFLPIHAAGYYHKGSTEKIFNYVVSSYTPNLQSLLPLQHKPASSFQGVLAVGQTNTKGMSNLPYTSEELNAVEKCCRGLRFTRLEDKDATVQAVVKLMEHHSCVHLACHASQSLDQPTSSGFYLYDNVLDLSTINQTSIPHARLAFLSACQTAQGDETLPEEAVHLAAAMLMKGYPSVIATMWSIEDEDGPCVASEFYSRWLKGAPESLKSAEALHEAVGVLRDKVGEQNFSRWVPFIHMGQ